MNRFPGRLRGGVFAVLVVLCGLRGISLGQSSQERVSLSQKSAISRYELAAVLQQVQCQDCRIPSENVKNTYTQSWVEEEKKNPEVFMDDIVFEQVRFEGEQYYYCVASTLDSGVMQGFPRDTSPLCYGKFCGSTSVTRDDLIGSMYRVLAPTVYTLYTVDWNVIRTRATNNPIISLNEATRIQIGAERCGEEACALQNPQELDVYLTYCAYNLGACGFQTFTNFSQGDRTTSYLNLLVTYQLLTRNQANDIAGGALAPGSTVTQMATALQDIVQCEFEDDYDHDGRDNTTDICPTIYDPAQRDSDDDRIGDVCDDDINNDGIKNPIGIIDFQGNINVRLLQDGMTETTIQQYLVEIQQMTGGAGATSGVGVGLEIDGSPRTGVAPLTVSFTGSYSGTIDTMSRSFGDDTQKDGIAVAHTFDMPGYYTITATAMRSDIPQAASTMGIEVLPSPDMQIGYQIVTSDLTVEPGQEVELSAISVGRVVQSTWQLGEEVVSAAPDTPAVHTFDTPGLYFVESQAYNAMGERAGLAQMTLDIAANGAASRGSYLRANTLKPRIGETVTFTTQTENIDAADIASIKREFGDDTLIDTALLSVTKSYLTAGTKVIHQYITFKDTTIPVHENVLTIHVTSSEVAQSARLDTPAVVWNAGESRSLTLELLAIAPADIAALVRNFGDGTKRTYTTVQRSHFIQSYSYGAAGSYGVTVYAYLRDGRIITTKVTLVIVGEDVCAGDISALRCDIDDDTIPDLCDDDIDGDGVFNRLGLYTKERTDCTYTAQEENTQLLEQYRETIKKGALLDNCELVVNSDQEDADADGYGTVCDDDDTTPPPTDGGGAGGGAGDSDGDGVPDDADACGSIPENVNGSEDADGCPEIPGNEGDTTDKEKKNPFIEAKQCTQCPCPYADYSSSLRRLDRVTAELRDETGTIKYRVTDPVIIERNIPDEMLGR